MSLAWLAIVALTRSSGSAAAILLFQLAVREQAYQQLEAFHAEQAQICRRLVEHEGHVYRIRKALVDRGACVSWALWMDTREEHERAWELVDEAEYHTRWEAGYRRAVLRPWIVLPPEEPFVADCSARPSDWLEAKARRYQQWEEETLVWAEDSQRLGRDDWTRAYLQRAMEMAGWAHRMERLAHARRNIEP